MKNFVQSGNTLEFMVAASVAAGEGIMMGDLFGVAVMDAEPSQPFSASVTGVFILPKVAGEITRGERVYWSEGDAAVTTDAASGANALIGAATEDADSGAAEVTVRLNGAVA